MSTIPSQTYSGPQLGALGGSFTTNLVNVSGFSTLYIGVKCDVDLEIVPMWTNFNTGFVTAGETLTYDASLFPNGKFFQISVANSNFKYSITVPGGSPTTSILTSVYGSFSISPPCSCSSTPPITPFTPEHAIFTVSDQFGGVNPLPFSLTTGFTTFTPFNTPGTSASISSTIAPPNPDFNTFGFAGVTYNGVEETRFLCSWGTIIKNATKGNIMTFRNVIKKGGVTNVANGWTAVERSYRTEETFFGGSFNVRLENADDFFFEMKGTIAETINIQSFYFNLIKVTY